jgi:hypothetical protein
VVVSLCGAAWTLWERRQRDPWLKLLQGATHKLKVAGLALPNDAADDAAQGAQPTPRQLAAALAQAKAQPQAPTPTPNTAPNTAPSIAPTTAPITDWLLRLEAWRYAPHSTPLGTLQSQYRQLPWPERNALKKPTP